MSPASLLRVPQQPQLPPPQAFFDIVGMPGGAWPEITASASYYNGKTYLGYLDADGNVRVASYNHTTRQVVVSPSIVTGISVDWHSAPSVLIRSSDHKILIAVAPHNTAHMHVAVSSNAEDASAWGAATDIGGTLSLTAATYANLVQLSGESGKIYLFYRDVVSSTNRLYMSTSTDGGGTWSARTQVYGNTSHQGYWVIDSDSTSRIDFIASDGAIDADGFGSLYHFYYTGGSYFKSDGTSAGSLPLAPASITKFYDSTTNGGVRVPLSVVAAGGPYAAWAAYNTAGAGSNENYWYGFYSGGSWTVNKIDDTGAVPEIPGAVEGGLAIDPIDPTKVYVSRKTSGRWQMLIYTTANGGTSWTNSQITTDTSDGGDVKPIRPRDAATGLRCLWYSGPYGPQGSPFSFKIRGYPNPRLT